jgi:Peptidase of plants and bacteria
VAGLSLFLVLVLGLVAWLVRREPTYHAPLDTPTAQQASSSDAAQLLRALQVAVRRDDPSAGSRLGAGSQGTTLLGAVVRNARALRVTGFRLRYVDQEGGVAPDGSWAAAVATSWRFAGFDRRPEHPEIRVRFAPTGGRLGISGIGGGDQRSPLWLAGPVQVRRSPVSLVVADATRAEADRLGALAARAVPQVRAVLPSWGGRVVVERPASEQDLDQDLAAHAGQYHGIAAVTTTVDGSRARGAPTHVFVNPDVFDPLGPHGAQVVVTHETTHVATHAATSAAPTWLVEGFADYVALRAQRLPLTTTASRIAALVRRSGAPEHLPGSDQFAIGTPDLEARYESAWLACRLLADDGGPAALVAFYRGMDAGHPLATELRRHFGFGLAGLTRQWRGVLSHLPA